MLTSGEAFGSGVAEGFTEQLQAARTNAGITRTIFIKCIFKPLFKIANSLVMCLLFFSQLAGQRIRFLLPGVLLIKCSLQVSCILIRSTEPLLIPLPFFFPETITQALLLLAEGQRLSVQLVACDEGAEPYPAACQHHDDEQRFPANLQDFQGCFPHRAPLWLV